MSDMATPQTQHDEWIDSEKACKILGLKLRAFQRKVQSGFVRRQILPPSADHNRQQALYSLEDVMNLKESKDNGASFAVAHTSAPLAAIAPTTAIALRDLQQTALQALARSVQQETKPPDKPWLTLKEAADYSGLPEHWLRRRCKESALGFEKPLGINVASLKRPKWMIKRTDLTEAI